MAFFPFNPRGQSHPFWDFIASMDNDFSDMRRPPSYAPPQERQAGPNSTIEQNQAQVQTQPQPQSYRAPSVEDENMAEARSNPAGRDLVDTEKETEKQAEKQSEQKDREHSSDEERWGGRRCRRGGPRGMHRHGPSHGPPPFGPFGFPPFFGGFESDFSDWTPPHHRHHGRHGPGGPRGHHHGGPSPPPPPPGAGHMPHPPPAGPHHRHGRRHCRGGPPGPPSPGREFNLPEFLNNLGQRLGIDLSAAASNLGAGIGRGTDNGDADFAPPHDLFDLHDEYLVHVSLPGANKDDIGLDFDGESHTLRVGGVVYRPGVDETISAAVVHSGRNREVGVFETKIRLPSHNASEVSVNASGINAKLREGVLVIHVPKLYKNKEDLKRSIRIDTPSPSPSPPLERPSTSVHPLDLPIHEKQQQPLSSPGSSNKANTFSPHTELDMYEVTPTPAPFSLSNLESTSPSANPEQENKNEKQKEKENETEDQVMHDDPPEQLPAYTATSNRPHSAHVDDKDYGDDSYGEEDDEGEYVKINVD